jgi:indole-3-glycerol phosphate synthase
MPLYQRAPAKVQHAFLQDTYNIIAEVKFASPSEGAIYPAAPQPVAIARGYLAAGATMLSILTEPLYFKGSLEYLAVIRNAHQDARLLRKDFINDIYQLHEARAYGADAVLLIVAMTGKDLTHDLYHAAHALGLDVLMEVHDADELQTAIDIGADLIGVNNRNLKTLEIDLGISRALAEQKPANAVFICESGLATPADVSAMRRLGYDGFLMGTHFMRQEKPGEALAAFMKGLADEN